MPRSTRARLAPRLFAALALSVGVLSVGVGCESRRGVPPPDDGANAPVRYEGATLDGARFSLADVRGDTVLLNVWATWCAPCMREMPLLAKVHTAGREAGLSVLGVSVDAQRNAQRVRDAVEDWALPFPVIHDPEGRVQTVFRVSGFPTTILLGPRGHERGRKEGQLDGPKDALLTQARTLANEARRDER